jgi:hypothetical protein
MNFLEIRTAVVSFAFSHIFSLDQNDSRVS